MGVEHKDSMTLVQMPLGYEGAIPHAATHHWKRPYWDAGLIGTNVLTGECGDISACQGEAGPEFLEVNGLRPSSSGIISQEHSGSY